jgi:ParB family chromosome partitioning protein
MKALGRQTLKVADIVIGERLRQIDEAHAQLLAENLRETGLLRNRPEVRQQKKGKSLTHTLIAGGHRIRAVEIVGWEEVEVDVYEGTDDEVLLWQIDENLVRHELNPLDRAVFMFQRKEIYERLHPEAKRGGDRKSNSHGDSSIGFARATADRINNLSEATIFRAIAIAKGLASDVRAALTGTELAKRQSELLALAKLGHGEQRQALALLIGDTPKAKNVAAAIKLIKGVRDSAPTGDDWFKALVAKWGRASPREREAFLEHLWINPKDATLREFVAALGQEEAA